MSRRPAGAAPGAPRRGGAPQGEGLLPPPPEPVVSTTAMGYRTPEASPARAVGGAPGGKAPEEVSTGNLRSFPPAEAPPAIPQRYRLRRGDGKSALLCEEAPRVLVRVRREYAFSEAEARALGERVILLDGAGSFGPLLDNAKRLYNLDHHSGCERTFTLATCEQALLLVHSGLDLSSGDWSVYANEPDLDTVLAIWCLLNHARLRQLRPEARDLLLPLIRLEGAIDANGNELAEFCGLPAALLAATRKRLDALLVREQRARSGGTWQTLDPEVYTAEMLHEIDRVVYAWDDFRDYASIEEIYGHRTLREGHIFVVCRDEAGIYAVEKLLKERWGEQLGVIALEREPGHYTLRRASPLSDIDLNVAYSALNLLDRNVDGRPPSKRWGGSEQIGGSPRPSGSALSPAELLRIVSGAYRRPGLWPRLWSAARTALLVAALGPLAALVGSFCGGLAVDVGLPADAGRVAGFSAALLAASLPLSWLLSKRRLWLHGWRRPAGSDWLALLPVAALGALASRAWFPAPAALEPAAVAATLAAAALAALALEAWFRGLAHGLLQLQSGVQTVGGPWRVSGANALAALLYSGAILSLSLRHPARPALGGLSALDWVLALVLGSFVAGLALGAIRERSLSLWPGAAAQLVGGLCGAALWMWLAAA